MKKSQRYLLGISSGRDSVALLHVLLDTGYQNLVLCHLNHNLRGKASDEDAAFLTRLGEKYNLPTEVKCVDVADAMAKNNESMELAARNTRHAFFSECANSYSCHDVLLAHHADDQAETILFNLLRGASGLRGMRFTSDLGELRLFRPLLHVSRSEIDTYLKNNGIAYREDESNAEPVAVRNRLRNEAIPLLNEIMGREIRPALLRATSISEQQDSSLRELLNGVLLEDPQGKLFLPIIAELSPALQGIVIHDYLKKSKISNITHDLLGRCITLITDQSTAKINLPGDNYLRRKEKRLFITS